MTARRHFDRIAFDGVMLADPNLLDQVPHMDGVPAVTVIAITAIKASKQTVTKRQAFLFVTEGVNHFFLFFLVVLRNSVKTTILASAAVTGALALLLWLASTRLSKICRARKRLSTVAGV